MIFIFGQIDDDQLSFHKADTAEIGLAADRAQAWKSNSSGNFIDLATVSFFTSRYLSDYSYESGNEWSGVATVFAVSVSIITLPFKLLLIALTNLRHIDV